ncbi:MAG TPA: hypothetical protein ENJ73_02500, partial [Desulfobacterales bacterium]|nr:hypothetical protein [Desulfobacterales bacterium]
MSTSSDAIVVDYGAVARLAAQQDRLPSVALLYPILGKGAPADSVLPHSLYYLYACLTDLGFAVTLQQWRVQDGARPLPAADVVYVHPMFATLAPACEALTALRAARPATTILLGNSDQHQHEMCLGGPAAEEAAQALLDRYPAIDGVLLGRNHEYSLARLLLNRAVGQPLDREVGQALLRRGDGGVALRRVRRVFALEDLPYLAFPGQPPAVVRIRSSVGCRGVCSYCIESRVNASS